MYPDMKALMNIVTEDPAAAHDEQLAAISQLIADRTEEENSPSKLSTDAFVSLANKMGLSLTRDTLMDLAQSGKLGAIIKDVNDDEIQFKGQHEIDGEVMDVDKAKKVVSKMARRNARKGVYGKYE